VSWTSEKRRNCRYSVAKKVWKYLMRCLVLLLALALSTPAVAADKGGSDKLVSKIDSIIATLHQQSILIEVRGAVPSGGWKTAKLKLVRSPADPHTVVLDFVATPPPANAAVIQGLLPVSANTVVRMRKGVVTVRAVATANEITTQILK
jgi:hypothetical protein